MTRKRMVWMAVLLATGGGAMAVLMNARGGVAAVSKPVAPPPAASQAVICAAGKVEPVSEAVTIASQLAGQLRQVPVEEGQHLGKGDVIAVLDNADYAARVAESRATVEVRQAELDRVVNGAREQERHEAAAAVEEAKAVVADTRSNMLRYQSLFGTGDVSRSDFERTQREYQVAEARLSAASQHFAFLDAPARADERAKAEANVALARAQLAEAEALLEKTVIRAPFDGVVLKRFRKAGEMVSDKTDSPIVNFGDESRLRVRVDVDETDVARLRAGERAYFTAQAFGDRKFWGRVTRIGRQLGKKNIDTGDPAEKVDTKVLETLVDLEGHPPLPAGLRVDSFIVVQ